MLKSLDFSVTFPTTGRSFKNRIEFEPGLTAIIGRNEAGKSLNLEMIGYCLFGKEALRGVASDYKNLTAELALQVGQLDLVISRAKKETLTENGAITAVGADAINKRIPEILGFGLNVFNIACAAQQGDLDALTKMKPTARRAMIDKLVGLDVLEKVEKDCRAEGVKYDTTATALIMNAREPRQPEKPQDYVEPAALEEKVVQLTALEAERKRLSQIPAPVEPVMPEAPELSDVSALEAHERNRQDVLQRKARLEGQFVAMPVPTVTRDQLQQAVDYSAYRDEVARRGAQPHHTLAELDQWEGVWHQKALLTSEPVECPSCTHKFIPNSEVNVAEIEALEQPPISLREIAADRRRHDAWAEPLAAVEEFIVPNLQKELLAHAQIDERAAVEAELSALVVPEDKGAALRLAREYQTQMAVYQQKLAHFNETLAAYTTAQEKLKLMQDQSETLAQLQTQLGSARAYDRDLDRYQTDLIHYQETVAKANAERKTGEGYKAGSTALKNARVRVKQELAPSLAKAASSLLFAMTNGERRTVQIDEDFNIIVDGQTLQTLSGSGKSVVNLALRIGLGQVLTSQVLPIFLGDEIDKDMDQTRAAATHQLFQNLKQYLTQIILVTHKDMEADYTLNQDMLFA